MAQPKQRPITAEDLYQFELVSQARLSPDGKWIAFISNRSENPDFTPWGTGLYVMPSGGGEFRKIDAPPGSKILPAFSQDGKRLAYYAFEGMDAE